MTNDDTRPLTRRDHFAMAVLPKAVGIAFADAMSATGPVEPMNVTASAGLIAVELADALIAALDGEGGDDD